MRYLGPFLDSKAAIKDTPSVTGDKVQAVMILPDYHLLSSRNTHWLSYRRQISQVKRT